MRQINERTKGTASTLLNSSAVDSNKHIYNLSAGDLNIPYPPLLKGGMESAIKKGIHNYSSTQGMLSLRKKLWNNPNEILLTNGAKSAIFSALMTLCKPGDLVRIMAPAWPSYVEMCKILGLKWELVYNNKLDTTNIEAKVYIINNPNNPTGKIETKEELKRIHQHCLNYDYWLISDECYSDIIYDNKPFYSLKGKENIIYINSFSKNMSIPGWRFGYAIGPEEVINQMTLIQSQINGPPNSLIQYAILKNFDWLEHIDINILQERRDFIASINSKFEESKPDAGLYFYIRKQYSDKIIKELWEQHNILLTPGQQFGSPQTIRLSFANIDLSELKEIAPILNRSINNE